MDLRVEEGLLEIHQFSVLVSSSLHSLHSSECPILESEFQAILDGIILAQRFVLSDLWIESNSTLAIHCITRGGGPWSIQATLRHIRHLLTFDRYTISHIYREENQVADLLASEGWDRYC
ncbi:Uncharacterized protein Adt_27737 [Abeliophyllum distichum]|uniref:RNase H type-1 domain-containing protein n=1 Tax=Abeliophyllum distichum TaxID=126358 RepID=A0ABD1RUL0_9LAMI